MPAMRGPVSVAHSSSEMTGQRADKVLLSPGQKAPPPQQEGGIWSEPCVEVLLDLTEKEGPVLEDATTLTKTKEARAGQQTRDGERKRRAYPDGKEFEEEQVKDEQIESEEKEEEKEEEEDEEEEEDHKEWEEKQQPKKVSNHTDQANGVQKPKENVKTESKVHKEWDQAPLKAVKGITLIDDEPWEDEEEQGESRVEHDGRVASFGVPEEAKPQEEEEDHGEEEAEENGEEEEYDEEQEEEEGAEEELEKVCEADDEQTNGEEEGEEEEWGEEEEEEDQLEDEGKEQEEQKEHEGEEGEDQDEGELEGEEAEEEEQEELEWDEGQEDQERRQEEEDAPQKKEMNGKERRRVRVVEAAEDTGCHANEPEKNEKEDEGIQDEAAWPLPVPKHSSKVPKARWGGQGQKQQSTLELQKLVKQLEDENRLLRLELGQSRFEVQELSKLRHAAELSRQQARDAKALQVRAQKDVEQAKDYALKRLDFARNEKAEVLKQVQMLEKELAIVQDREGALRTELQETLSAAGDTTEKLREKEHQMQHYKQESHERLSRCKQLEARVRQLEEKAKKAAALASSCREDVLPSGSVDASRGEPGGGQRDEGVEAEGGAGGEIGSLSSQLTVDSKVVKRSSAKASAKAHGASSSSACSSGRQVGQEAEDEMLLAQTRVSTLYRCFWKVTMFFQAITSIAASKDGKSKTASASAGKVSGKRRAARGPLTAKELVSAEGDSSVERQHVILALLVLIIAGLMAFKLCSS